METPFPPTRSAWPSVPPLLKRGPPGPSARIGEAVHRSGLSKPGPVDLISVGGTGRGSGSRGVAAAWPFRGRRLGICPGCRVGRTATRSLPPGGGAEPGRGGASSSGPPEEAADETCQSWAASARDPMFLSQPNRLDYGDIRLQPDRSQDGDVSEQKVQNRTQRTAAERWAGPPLAPRQAPLRAAAALGLPATKAPQAGKRPARPQGPLPA